MQTYFFMLAVCDPIGPRERVRDSIRTVLGERYFQIGEDCQKSHGYITHFWLADMEAPDDSRGSTDEQPLFYGEDLFG